MDSALLARLALAAFESSAGVEHELLFEVLEPEDELDEPLDEDELSLELPLSPPSLEQHDESELR